MLHQFITSLLEVYKIKLYAQREEITKILVSYFSHVDENYESKCVLDVFISHPVFTITHLLETQTFDKGRRSSLISEKKNYC